MATNEATILRNYLLLPARLPTFISLQDFTSLFPKSQQSSPQIRALYRDLQQQRNSVVDGVSQNIDAQIRQGKALRREVIKARREAELEEQDDEIEIERTLFGPTSSTLQPKQHTLLTILPDMDGAVADIEREISAMEEEEAALLESIKQVVGNMSDLRYGRFGNPKLKDDVLDGLRRIEDVCRHKT
ncbi:Cnl2/NKP2 family protein-domain-containing protein [Hypoxylon fragiforme]|uniref:Cnl2/NKP2 family protein-domain-containing protein n=1 Tax=Hypoxylon fragiforme TaxID=63214 RepID=UPI0020C5B8F0|nr:Cnl2/NKP2 family protein-domain-containing protein [Hypoxylon fragiforme]KAI2610826.1 Cnl2/NKP2 family protein-domain-containing protein [Hypoxylon fragiforme]